MSQELKVTYATLSVDNEELQSAYDEAIAQVRVGWLDVEVPMFIDGEKVYADDKFESYSP
nr:L-glutamate gamma-semialdehyde dehydrogenase [Anaerolineae bacterium]